MSDQGTANGKASHGPSADGVSLSKYDVVVVTRNRPEVLPQCLGSILSQSVLPERVIIVDSSDDHEEVRRTVSACTDGCGVEIQVVQSGAGIPLQRNVGLRLVTAPIVLMPDDDSLMYPGAVAEMLRIYALDVEGRIGGVCTAEADSPPGRVESTKHHNLGFTIVDQILGRIGPTRDKIERRVFPDPFILHGRARWTALGVPDWLAAEDVVPVEWMTGFRMSFRTDLIRRASFDESLAGYALFEDVDASFSIARTHLIVGARRAQIHHHRAGGKRAASAKMGAMQILNRALIVAKHWNGSGNPMAALTRYSRYKLFLYALTCIKPGGSLRFRAAWRSCAWMRKISESSPAERTATYNEAMKACTAGLG
jgi:glycosyltransferase involved in cell wall biosynthesis